LHALPKSTMQGNNVKHSPILDQLKVIFSGGGHSVRVSKTISSETVLSRVVTSLKDDRGTLRSIYMKVNIEEC
jgi:hypothetical protein